MVMKMIPFFQKKPWGVLLAQVFSLVLVISLALPTLAASAAPSALEGSWHLIDFDRPPTTLDLFDGNDNGRMYCNSYAGGYFTEKDADNCAEPVPISFTPQATTYVGCDKYRQEIEYLESLEAAEEYAICDDTLVLFTPYKRLLFSRIQ